MVFLHITAYLIDAIPFAIDTARRFVYLFVCVHTLCRIPHDINTMHELWGVNSYRKQNKYLSTASIMEAIAELPDSPIKKECLELRDKLMKEYDRLSNKYHTEKVNNPDNSLVLG